MSLAFYTGDQYLLLYLFSIRGNAHPRGIMLTAECCVYGSCCHVFTVMFCVIADAASGTHLSTHEGMSS